MKLKSTKSFFIKLFILLSILCFESKSSNAFAQLYTSEKPLFVVISTDWCFACKLLKPVIEKLKDEYSYQVEFVELDPTNEQNADFTAQLVRDYGISDFYNKNKGIFPTVGILSPSGEVKGVFVGARPKETYLDVLNPLLGIQVAKKEEEPVKPQEVKPEDEVKGGRPDNVETSPRPKEVEFLERPQELAFAGRPPELTFWAVGQSIPYSAYSSYLVLPNCIGGNIVCSNGTAFGANTKSNNSLPVFKPWNTGTRDEKGLQLKK